jgi:Methyltransferase domain
LSREVAKVAPSAIRRKISVDLRGDVDHTAWSTLDRSPIAQTDKYQSIALHFRDRVPWDDTPLFRDNYRRRLDVETVRGCRTWAELLAYYAGPVERLYADMVTHGFRRDAPPVPVYVADDAEILLGNQGNHRIAMAQLLDLPAVYVDIVGRHPGAGTVAAEPVPDVVEPPILTAAARSIPAMTTDAERRCYYRLAVDRAPFGEVVELGAWLGAATVWLAAGIRDVGVPTRLHTFDRFVWKPTSHDKKAGGRVASQRAAFDANLGDLLPYVVVHEGELSGLKWTGQPVALLVCDAPKRIPEIATTLTAFADALGSGALMAWQDFAYFPSYDIPAALMQLGDAVELVEAVYPGTTAVFRVRRSWKRSDVSPAKLSLATWSADDIESAWDTWTARLPEPMRPRFACGAAMFLVDRGAVDRARRRLKAILASNAPDVLPKWRYLFDERSGLMRRYGVLADLCS